MAPLMTPCVKPNTEKWAELEAKILQNDIIRTYIVLIACIFYLIIPFLSFTVNPSASSLPPAASSSVATPVTLPPDVQR